MKRRIAALCLLALMLVGAARGEALMSELRNMRKSAGDRILELESVPTPDPNPTPEPSPTPDIHFEPLSPGMKGDEVSALQQRLIDLGYLNGRADGSYGNKTADAVKAFQSAAGLEPTGEADDETQRALKWPPASVHKDHYEKLDYQRALEAPEEAMDASVTLSGKVLQVLESDEYADTLGIYTALRVATKGDYDNVVYITYFRPTADAPVVEGDAVSVRGTLKGLYRYETEAGDEIALPRVEADAVDVLE